MIDSHSELIYALIEKCVINSSIEKAPEHSPGARGGERTSWYMGSLQPVAEGSPAPEVAESASFERSVTRRPTVSSRWVDTSQKAEFRSRKV